MLQKVYSKLLSLDQVTSQQDFAEKLGFTPGYVSRLLKSDKPVPKEVAPVIADKFGVSLEYLASNGEQGSMFPITNKSEQTNGTEQSDIQDNVLNSSGTKNNNAMLNLLNKTLGMLERELDRNDQRWNSLLGSHSELIKRIPPAEAGKYPKALAS